jgi:Protein of unknown function (DUF1573)
LRLLDNMTQIRFILFSILLLLGQSIAFAQTDRSANAGKVDWGTPAHDLGEVAKDSTVKRIVVVKNISQEDLLLLSVLPMCHCTTAEWPQEPIPPGEQRNIILAFHAERAGEFYKIITVKTNFDPVQPYPLVMKGKVVQQ